jgi:phosphohistidine phosphatase SixA
MEVKKVAQKKRFIDWKTKRVETAWESLLYSSEIKKMIEEADNVDNGLILRIVGHSLNKGETIKYLNYQLIC